MDPHPTAWRRAMSRAALLLLLLATSAAAATLHVDVTLGTASCVDYDPATRACGTGIDSAWRTLAGAAAVAAPGDVVLVRDGTYAEALVPGTSGIPGAPITYRAFAGEAPVISRASLDPAIDLSGRSWIVLDGLSVDGVVGWLRAQDAHWNVVRGCTFRRATAGGSRAGLKFIDATYNRVEGCVVDDGNDNLLLIASDHNVVEGNRITLARHGLWSILCGNENVIRGNYFHNAIQKAGQITDCEGVPSDTPVRYDATKRNLVEWNVFAYTASSGDASPYAGIQHAGQGCIVRRNLFHDTVGPAFDLTLYPDEARFNTGNRICHDVFLSTDFAGVSVADDAASLADNLLVNNVLARSAFVANDGRWPWYVDDLAGRPVQVLTGRLDGFRFERNDVFGSTAGEAATVVNGVRWSGTNPPFQTLAWWEANHTDLFAGNLEVDPGFVDEARRDVHLAAGSPLIDAGAFLTRAVGSGAGARLPVEDVGWFFDGFGIPGEVGDLVQLDGASAPVRVLAIDRAGGALLLDAPVTWVDGLGVSLAYQGSAPDVGMYEWTPPSQPPSMLRNATLSSLTFAQHAALLTAGRDPVLDPVRDLYLADVSSLTEVRLPGEADPVGSGSPGVLVFYEVSRRSGPLAVTKDAADVVLRGW